jgi:hypothetical protein
MLYEVNNRGNIAMLGQLNEASFSRNDPTTSIDAGNRSLFRRVYEVCSPGGRCRSHAGRQSS